jgi:GAF domain-containing protein
MRIATVKIAKARTLVGVPMLKGDEVIGIIGIYRQEVRPFTNKQVNLLTNFAAQAVIAIENARLLSEIEAIAGAADGDLGSAPGHLKLSWRFAALRAC